MDNISTQFNNDGNKDIIERRTGDRRCRERRNASNNTMHSKGAERRSVNKDRRTTLFNRLKREVTDRRSLN
jgi:hypothetical protein